MNTNASLQTRTNDLSQAFVEAVVKRIKTAGTQKKLADTTGIHQSRISAYANGNYDFSNLSLGTLIRLFPDLQIAYIQDNRATQNDLVVEMEERLIALFRGLEPRDQVRCFELLTKITDV